MDNNIQNLQQKILLLKQLGLKEDELVYVKKAGEDLDSVFSQMKEKLSITDEFLGKMFSIFFCSEFAKVMKEKECEFQMMEEDENEPAIAEAVAKVYGEVFVRFCQNNDNIGVEEAKSFKENFAKFFPIVMKLEKESPAGLESFFKQTGNND